MDIDPNKIYTIHESIKLHPVLEQINYPRLLGMVKVGKLKAVDISSGKKTWYTVKGSELIKFIEQYG